MEKSESPACFHTLCTCERPLPCGVGLFLLAECTPSSVRLVIAAKMSPPSYRIPLSYRSEARNDRTAKSDRLATIAAGCVSWVFKTKVSENCFRK